MKKLVLFSPLVLLISISFYAQKVARVERKAPISIYTFNSLKKDIHDTASLNKRLNIGSFKSVFLDVHNIDQKINPLNFIEIGETTSAYVFDDYAKYQNNDFIKEFIFENDPTRWNLHRIKKI